MIIETAAPDFDESADVQIRACLNPAAPQSFFSTPGQDPVRRAL